MLSRIRDFFSYFVLLPERSRHTEEYYKNQTDNIYLQTSDGKKIGAYLTKFGKSEVDSETLFFIFCHGTGCDRVLTKCDIKNVESDSIILIPEYRGFGESKESTTKDGLNLDLEAAFEFLMTTYNPKKIFIIGHSYGCAVAANYFNYSIKKKAKIPAKAYLIAPFSSSMDMVYAVNPNIYYFLKYVPLIKWLLLKEVDYDNFKLLKNIKDKCILFHGEMDENISYKNSLKLADSHKIKLICFEDNDHFDILKNQKLWKEIEEDARKELNKFV